MVIPAEGRIRSHVVFSSEVRDGRFRIFSTKSWKERTETLRRYSVFPANHIKCKVAKVMGEEIRVLIRPASVAVFSALFFSSLSHGLVHFVRSFCFAKRELKRPLQH